MSKVNKLYRLLHIDCKLSVPDLWDHLDQDELYTQLSLLMPGFHFEFWYQSPDLEINVDCLFTVVQRMLEHKNAKEIYHSDIGGEDYDVFILAFKD